MDHKKILLAILIVALLIRVFLAVGTDNFNHSDEVYQIYEQAHRLVFGYGMVTWEYRHAARSWIIPGLTAGMLYPYKLLGLDDPRIYIPGIKIMLAILSLIIVLTAYQIGKTMYNSKAGLWASFFCAVWFDIAYFSIRPLSEVWATIFLISAIALIMYKQSKSSFIISAILLFMVGAIRINYIPAVLFIFVYNLCSNKEYRLVYSIGFIGAILAFVLFEWITLGFPNVSHYNQFMLNQSFFMKGAVGTSFSIEYFLFLGYSSLFIFWLCLLGGMLSWKKHKILILTIIIILVSNILIPAKDHQSKYRHILAIVPLLLVIGGSFISTFSEKYPAKFNAFISPILVVLVLSISTIGAFGKFPFQSKIYKEKIFNPSKETIFENRDHLKAFRFLSQEKNIIGVYDISQKWFRSGSYYYLHQDVPIYYFDRTPANMGYISHFITDFGLRDNEEFTLIKRIGNLRIHKRTDSLYKYMIDPKYNRDIYQTDIDNLK